MRTKIIKHFAHNFGPFWFMDESKAVNQSHFFANLDIIRKEVARSHDDFIKEHFRKYSEPELPPVWKTLEVVSMGTLSKLFNNFSDATAKHAVAREFGLNHHKFLRSWLECLAIVRNCCAHHSRLVNRVFPIKPMMPQRLSNAWITNFSFREQTLYPQLCYLVYCFNAVSPDNWDKEPLWKNPRKSTDK